MKCKSILTPTMKNRAMLKNEIRRTTEALAKVVSTKILFFSFSARFVANKIVYVSLLDTFHKIIYYDTENVS